MYYKGVHCKNIDKTDLIGSVVLTLRCGQCVSIIDETQFDKIYMLPCKTPKSLNKIHVVKCGYHAKPVLKTYNIHDAINHCVKCNRENDTKTFYVAIISDDVNDENVTPEEKNDVISRLLNNNTRIGESSNKKTKKRGRPKGSKNKTIKVDF